MNRYFSKTNIDLLERVPKSLLLVGACYFALHLAGFFLMSENQESNQQEDKDKIIQMRNFNKIEPISVSVISENHKSSQQEDEKKRNLIDNEEIESNQINQVNSLGMR